MILKVKLDKDAFPPCRAYPFDAGLDLFSPVETVIPARGAICIDTGVHVQLEEGTAGFLKSKSGLNVRHGILSDGTIDAHYNGSIVVKLYNHNDIPFPVHRGTKISQLVIQPVLLPEVEVVEELDETDRGSNGFGSTGAGV